MSDEQKSTEWILEIGIPESVYHLANEALAQMRRNFDASDEKGLPLPYDVVDLCEKLLLRWVGKNALNVGESDGQT